MDKRALGNGRPERGCNRILTRSWHKSLVVIPLWAFTPAGLLLAGFASPLTNPFTGQGPPFTALGLLRLFATVIDTCLANPSNGLAFPARRLIAVARLADDLLALAIANRGLFIQLCLGPLRR